MTVLGALKNRWHRASEPFMIDENGSISFSEIFENDSCDLSEISQGAVVALIGDFDARSICILLRLIDLNAIIVPLTEETSEQHQYFFQAACVEFVIREGICRKVAEPFFNKTIESLQKREKPGLVLFSSGTTGKPKAILHDFSLFLKRYEEPRPTLKVLNFLLFDHIGGINTLFHTLYNRGLIITCKSRRVEDILALCREHNIEVLPTTPTFLRMMLLSGLIPSQFPDCLKIITYGTERLDQITLSQLCDLLPGVDFRQTYGMSELGILRVKSEARDSLFMKIGGEGVESKIEDNILYLRSKTRMMGYLNAPSPFDNEGWYCTQDKVELKDGFIRIVGRNSEVINVGGLKFMAADVEQHLLKSEEVNFAKVYARPNPITGQHVEAIIQPRNSSTFDLQSFKNALISKIPKHMMPRRFKVQDLKISHRYKKL